MLLEVRTFAFGGAGVAVNERLVCWEFCFVIQVLFTWICLVCGNILSYTVMTCALFCMYIIIQQKVL